MHPSEIFSRIFDIGVDVLSSTLDPKTGTLTVQLGDVTKGTVDSAKAELWQGASGVASRPALPTKGNASCQAIVCKHSQHDMVIAVRDLRATSIYGNLAPGDTCVYATSGQARAVFKSADGSARQMTTDDNTATGNVIMAGISSYYTGLDQQRHPGGEWRYYAPWGGQWHDPLGYHLRHWTGAKIDVGGTTVTVAGLSKTGSSMTFTADLMRISGAQVSIGRGVGDSVVQVTPLAAIMTTLATSLTELAVELAAAGGSLSAASDPKVVAAGTSVSAAAVTLQAAITALGTVLATTATKSLSAA